MKMIFKRNCKENFNCIFAERIVRDRFEEYGVYSLLITSCSLYIICIFFLIECPPTAALLVGLFFSQLLKFLLKTREYFFKKCKLMSKLYKKNALSISFYFLNSVLNPVVQLH